MLNSKNDLLKSSKHVFWDLIKGLEAFNLQFVPRNQNKHADKLVVVGAQYDIPTEISKSVRKNHVKVIMRPVVPNNAKS